MVFLPSYLVVYKPKFHRPSPHFHPVVFFHQYASSEPLRKLSNLNDNSGYPNLLNHKDWLSQPQVIRIFQNLKDPNFALPLLYQLSERRDYNPNESLYSTVVNKLAVAKNFDGIETLMQRIKLERKCRLSDAFFRNVIKIYGHSAGRINKAIETLFDMPNYKCWPRVETFNCVLNLLVSTKQFEVVHQVYVKASELGVEIDACCLNIMIKGLCECGQIDDAYKVLDEFTKQRCRPNVRTFSTIMHGLCEYNRVDEALGLLERMEMEEGVGVDAIVFNILILGLRKGGRFEEGITLFDKMMLKGCHPNPGTYQEVLYCLLDAKRFSEAKCFTGSIIEKGVKPSFESYKLLIQGFCNENLVEDVEWTLRQMVGSGFVPKMGLWKQIVWCMLWDKQGESLMTTHSSLYKKKEWITKKQWKQKMPLNVFHVQSHQSLLLPVANAIIPSYHVVSNLFTPNVSVKPRQRTTPSLKTKQRFFKAAICASLAPLDLTEDNIKQVLDDARTELGQLFDTSVNITGKAELVELDGPYVTISLSGRFWHERSLVLARLGNYLKQRIPEILEVDIEDEKQLDDSPENF